MFGYVGIYKDELKVKDYRLFQAYYCGLCKELGKSFRPALQSVHERAAGMGKAA